MEDLIDYTVEYAKTAWAAAFAADLPRFLGVKYTGATRKGKVVTFKAPRLASDGQSLLTDLREFVGYHGAPSSPGKVNGVRAVPCY